MVKPIASMFTFILAPYLTLFTVAADATVVGFQFFTGEDQPTHLVKTGGHCPSPKIIKINEAGYAQQEYPALCYGITEDVTYSAVNANNQSMVTFTVTMFDGEGITYICRRNHQTVCELGSPNPPGVDYVLWFDLL